MKVIDLLNKIAKGEEVPKKIITLNSLFEYNEYDNDYYCGNTSLFTELVGATDLLEEVTPVEILDEEEKKYLSAVIKPFRNKVEYICRNSRYNGTLKRGGYSYISIKCKNDDDFCYRSGLPIFETDTMYKGMKLDESYTLEDLNL